MAEIFERFTERPVTTSQGDIRIRFGGSGFPILLLHGHPRERTTWLKVAPQLARNFTVVCADMPGFGGSYQLETVAASSGKVKAAALHECMLELDGMQHSLECIAIASLSRERKARLEQVFGLEAGGIETRKPARERASSSEMLWEAVTPYRLRF
ncbi:alpha/beta fold hydrolase [Rhizobium sp. CFBP 13726]|uniref:alpha/beta fold hydrolase n=1 Tax=Rhizobium sp. CFBP 13726 TaxID=2775296 RepID=UPI00406D4B4C